MILGVPILNKALPLRTHDIVRKIGDTGSRRCPHDCRYGSVVTGGPANRSQIKAGVFWRPIVFEAADAGVEIKNRGGGKTCCLTNRPPLGLILFPATGGAQA